MNFLEGWRTYLSAAGLLGLALYQLSQNDFANAFQSLMAAIATFGIRNTLARNEEASIARHKAMLVNNFSLTKEVKDELQSN